eukprot:scaffold792_cov163-Amphora_coffeaeformis.AAC.4
MPLSNNLQSVFTCRVFQLLETLYSAFDKIAKRRKVFKVEVSLSWRSTTFSTFVDMCTHNHTQSQTIGDCYVAATGLPEKMDNHFIVMARFARDCLEKMQDELMFLESSLGPDTGSLGMRIGIHSGPVTAGVLRGERARFQLFGDTVNTTARIESTGAKNRIHVSEQTANLLISAGKQDWVQQRTDRVTAKGKGELQTYWLTCSRPSDADKSVSDDNDMSTTQHSVEEPQICENTLSQKEIRLIDWNVDVLSRFLRNIQTWRETRGTPAQTSASAALKHIESRFASGSITSFDEIQDVIQLPTASVSGKISDVEETNKGNFSESVLSELSQFVTAISSMHNKNSFHNFEHASHVQMSVAKLLSRIVQPEGSGAEDFVTMGIRNNPLTHFALVFSALIHDVGHLGVSNAQLVKENSPLAIAYHNKSVLEQQSVDLGFALLMDDSFANLRAAIYSNEEEFKLFRQLVVNAVLATDVMDKELGAARKHRWQEAFSDKASQDSPEVVANRKATIVIEHLIQASDVAHTMQHWQ